MRHRLCILSLAVAGAALALASCGNESTATPPGTATASAKAAAPPEAGKPGDKAPAKAASSVTFQDDFEFIRIEAEAAEKIEGEIMRVVDDPEASGGKCIEIPDKVGTPWPKDAEPAKMARAVYRFTVKSPGNYTFWCRRKWFDQCGDTFAVRFDRESQPRDEKTELLFGADDSSKPPRWGWTPVRQQGNPRQFFLDAGPHVLEILNREDGPRFDVLLLTNDRDYVPVGMEND
mgnify:CR=1 FL=1